MEKKLVIVIGGRSGAGKSTLIKIAADEFMVRKISSVDGAKKVAAVAGWNGLKDIPGQQLLADLNHAMVAYDDSPNKALLQEYLVFKSGGEQILFAHIREPEDIQKFVDAVREKGGKVVTLFVTRKEGDPNPPPKAPTKPLTPPPQGYIKPDAPPEFKYDHTFENDKPLEESGKDFIAWLKAMLG